MRKKFLGTLATFGIGGVILMGCMSPAGTAPTSGQLFCQVAQSDGASMIVDVIDALIPGAVLVTGLAAADVQKDCAQVAANVGASSAIPVSPPASTVAVGTVAITPAVRSAATPGVVAPTTAPS